MKAPVAKKIAHVSTRHGREFRDDYHWLREKSNPEVTAYLEAENVYTAAVMQPTDGLQETLYREIVGRIKETDLSVPERFGDYEYYSRTVEGLQYAIHCRKAAQEGAQEEVLLDENKLAEGHDYFSLGQLSVSPDHRLVAFCVDTAGDEQYAMRFKDLSTGELLPDEVAETYTSIEWAADNRTVFYNTLDDAHRPHRLWRHRLGQAAAADEMVFEESDDSFFLGLYKTKDRRYLVLHLDSNRTSEAYFLDASAPDDAFRVIEPRRPGVEYGVEHHSGKFLILTNDRAVNFKLVTAPVDSPGAASWTEFLPYREEIKLDSIEVFKDQLALVERENGLRGIRVIDLGSLDEHRVEFPEPVYTVYMHRNPEFETNVLRFSYTSLVTPRSVFDYDLVTRKRELRKEQEVLGGYDRTLYESERVTATASDGAQVPVSLFYRKGFPRDGSGPLLLYGYGSYGASIDPSFDSSRLSLVDRGFAFAIAHVRGGGEMGRPWYENGKLLHKRNTFTDFIACAEHMIEAGYTSSERLAIRGGSAGGLLMGAVTNMRPDLFRAVVANVPFVDVVNTMLDRSLPLTVIEWEEWGNPHEREFHDYIESYSPYDNVEAKNYPHMLITTGLNDPRVAYWEPAKWIAKLRQLRTNDNQLLLKTNMGAGHGGASGRYDRIRELALEYAFILDRASETSRTRSRP